MTTQTKANGKTHKGKAKAKATPRKTTNKKTTPRAPNRRRKSITKSSRIKQLAADGLPTAEIARKMNIRYQHAYNVLHEPVQKDTVSTPEYEGKERRQSGRRVEDRMQA